MEQYAQEELWGLWSEDKGGQWVQLRETERGTLAPNGLGPIAAVSFKVGQDLVATVHNATNGKLLIGRTSIEELAAFARTRGQSCIYLFHDANSWTAILV